MLNVNIKDSDWPEWANWVAQNECGAVYFFSTEPIPGKNFNVWNCFSIGGYELFTHGKSNPLWRDSLTYRHAKRQGVVSVEKHSHYFKDVSNLQKIDVYRVLDLYEVTDPCIQHAVKKLLVAGKRGAKDQDKDIQEAIDTLARWQNMQGENNG